MKMAIRWEIQVNQLVKIAKLTGTMIYDKHNEFTSRLLLGNAMDIIDIAQKYQGCPLQADSPPINKGNEYVYFEVIFKNDTDLNSFMKAIANRSSK